MVGGRKHDLLTVHVAVSSEHRECDGAEHSLQPRHVQPRPGVCCDAIQHVVFPVPGNEFLRRRTGVQHMQPREGSIF